MYFVDNHVADMLWGMQQHNVADGIVEYRIPLAGNLFTKIIGEWVWHTSANSKHEGYFLVHSWENP